MTFPSGWKTQNLPQAVVGVSPRQDAAIQLTLARDDPNKAAEQFLGQQGLQPGQVSRRSVNGLSAVIAQFAAQTQQGPVQGLVGFVPYGKGTYQVLGYSPAQRYPAMEAGVPAHHLSFGPLNDREALNVQPRHIELVTLPRAMSLREFARVYPSTVNVRTLALINQLPNTNARVPAGKVLKRIVEK